MLLPFVVALRGPFVPHLSIFHRGEEEGGSDRREMRSEEIDAGNKLVYREREPKHRPSSVTPKVLPIFVSLLPSQPPNFFHLGWWWYTSWHFSVGGSLSVAAGRSNDRVHAADGRQTDGRTTSKTSVRTGRTDGDFSNVPTVNVVVGAAGAEVDDADEVVVVVDEAAAEDSAAVPYPLWYWWWPYTWRWWCVINIGT